MDIEVRIFDGNMVLKKTISHEELIAKRDGSNLEYIGPGRKPRPLKKYICRECRCQFESRSPTGAKACKNCTKKYNARIKREKYYSNPEKFLAPKRVGRITS